MHKIYFYFLPNRIKNWAVVGKQYLFYWFLSKAHECRRENVNLTWNLSFQELNIYSSFHEENVNTKLDVSHLRVLSHLDLSYNSITELGNDWFENGPASLTHLILTNNGIEALGDKAFRSLVNIQELWIDGNRFGPITRNMLPSPSNHLIELQLV